MGLNPYSLVPNPHRQPRFRFTEVGIGPSGPAVADHAAVGVVEIVEAVEEAHARVHERLRTYGVEHEKVRREWIAAPANGEPVAGRLDRFLGILSREGEDKL